MATTVNPAPRVYTYQDSRLILGNARSRAPIIMGTRKFPSTAGMEGIRKKKIMVMPCIVNNLLYVSAWTRSPCGVSSSSRRRPASTPPSPKKRVMEIRYRMAIRLWSVVKSHDRTL